MFKYIEKNGTGLTKVIERNGTGIEKNGTGIFQMIEKSGTGIRRSVFLFSVLISLGLASVSFGSDQGVSILKQENSVAIAFSHGDERLLGVGVEKDGYLIVPIHSIKSEGGGTGYRTKSEGGGTGYRTKSEGGGTGYSIKSEGGGTGSRTKSEGGGTGSRIKSEGGGTGSRIKSEGGGTGYHTNSEGGGTGQKHWAYSWGYAEIALNDDKASVLIYRNNGRGGLVEVAALELPVFE